MKGKIGIIAAAILLLAGLVPAVAEEILPVPGREERFLELLREVSPLPGDLRASRVRAGSSGGGLEPGAEEGFGDPGLLLGRPEARYSGRSAAGGLTVTGPGATIMSPVPVLPSLDLRADWTLVLAMLRDEREDGEDVDLALGRIRAHPVAQEDGRVAFLTGLTAFHRGDAEAAKTAFAAAADAEPEDPYPLFGIALLHLVEGDAAGALPAIERAREIAPESVTARALLGEALLRMGAFADAEPHLRVAAASPDAGVRLGLLHGIALLRSGRPAAAAEAFRKVKATGDAAFPVNLLAARAELRLGRADRALDHLELALAVHPDHFDARVLRAWALAGSGEGAAGADLAERLTEERPDSPGAWASRAVSEMAAGKPDDARASAERWLELAKDDFSPRVVLARLALEAGRPDDAVRQTTVLVAKERARPGAVWLLHGKALAAAGRGEEAAAAFRRVVEIAPASPAAEEAKKRLSD